MSNQLVMESIWSIIEMIEMIMQMIEKEEEEGKKYVEPVSNGEQMVVNRDN